jgi:aromatic ring-opening dioxygenase LigB subunit
MYVKDQGEWEKEDEKKTKLTKAVKTIANKNIRLLPQFREKYPEYNKSTTKISDTYDKIVIESMTSDDFKNEKIIKKISKATIIKEI